jgi:hypothetical protein
MPQAVYFGKAPELIFIDWSHQYAPTQRRDGVVAYPFEAVSAAFFGKKRPTYCIARVR